MALGASKRNVALKSASPSTHRCSGDVAREDEDAPVGQGLDAELEAMPGAIGEHEVVDGTPGLTSIHADPKRREEGGLGDPRIDLHHGVADEVFPRVLTLAYDDIVGVPITPVFIDHLYPLRQAIEDAVVEAHRRNPAAKRIRGDPRRAALFGGILSRRHRCTRRLVRTGSSARTSGVLYCPRMRRPWKIIALRDELDEGRQRQIASQVALALGVPLVEARAFLGALPQPWPKDAEPEALAKLGLEAEPGRPVEEEHCEAHPQLWVTGWCAKCEAGVCSVCTAASGASTLCSDCTTKKGRSRRFFYVRVTILLSILGIVLLYAWNRHRRLERRSTWKRPLEVAVVVVPQGPMDTSIVEELRARGNALQRQLSDEYRRHRPGGIQPFRITVYVAPGASWSSPPVPDDVDGVAGLARYTWDKRAWVSSVDDAVGLASGGLDARIYLVARPVADGLVRTVEGVGEDGGTIGIVQIDLSDDTVDLALFVAAHELFHLVGAEDRYGPTGDVLIPSGLAEPGLEPRYPQRFTELMARQRPISATRQVLPESLDELRVGETTAREIGWTAPPAP